MKRSEINASFQWDAAIDSTVMSKKQKYIDFTSGIFVANLGHNYDAVCRAIANTLSFNGPHSYTYGLPVRDEYIKKLCGWSGFEHAHLFTTGSEAVEAAMRVCWHMGKDADDFYALPGSFHGKTWGPSLITRRIPDDYGADFCKDDVVLVEGYRGWDCHFWEYDLIQTVKHAGIIIVDEVQSGFYRTGRQWAHEWYDGLEPDMIVTGKAQGNGYPVSAVMANGKCAEVLRDKADDFSSTHGGNPIACSAGLAVVESFEREGSMIGKRFDLAEMLEEVGCPYPVNGRGAVAAIMTGSVKRADEVVLKCREKGLLVVHTGKSSVKLGPPLTIEMSMLDRGIDILKEVLCAT